MLLAIDVGNTHTTMGIYKNDQLLVNWRINTDKEKTSDEIGILLLNLFNYENVCYNNIKDIIIASVVPPVMNALKNAIRKYLKKEPIIVNNDLAFDLDIKYENKKDVGTDRIVNAIGALAFYKAPMIIVDFGTATTFCVISDKNEYLGGAILPGIKISMNALFEKTAKLPRIDIEKPSRVIGTNTAQSMQSGVYYGYVGSVDYTVEKIKEELKRDDVTVIATGGLAQMIAEDSKTIEFIDTMITLKGLNILYKKIKEVSNDN